MILFPQRGRTMRPKRPETTRSGDLFRARLDQIITLKHELAQLAGQIDWDFIDGEIAPLYSDKGRPGIPTRFAMSDEYTVPLCRVHHRDVHRRGDERVWWQHLNIDPL